MFERKCPKCGRVIKYSSKKCLDRSIKKKRLCSICAGKARYVDGKHPYNYKGEKPPFERSCPKCGKILKHFTSASLKAIAKKGRTCRSCANKGENNPMYGRTGEKCPRYGTIGEKHPLFGVPVPEDRKKKISKHHKGIKLSEEHKQSLSRAAIKRIKESPGQFAPNYNLKSIPILQQVARDLGLNIQHAENGGEFYIKGLGYWVDGYDKEKNVVIEYYEKAHNRFREKDEKRKQEIMNFLKCEFIEIWEDGRGKIQSSN